MRIRAKLGLRLWLAAEMVTAFESVRHPPSDLDASLFAMVSMLGAALAVRWLARHGRHLPAQWSQLVRADRLCGSSVSFWVLALTAFALPARVGLLDVGRGLAVTGFALSSLWAIRHRPRWIIAGLTAVGVANWLSTWTSSPRSPTAR